MIFDFILFCFLVLYIIVGWYWMYSFHAGAPFYPSNRKAIKEIVKQLQAEKVTNVAELGSGDGRVAVAIAKAGIKVTAIELNPLLSLITRFKKFIYKLDNLTVINKNVLSLSYHNYDGAILYLFSPIMEKLAAKLTQEMPNKSTIISNTFKFKTLKPVRTIDNRILVYHVKK